LLGEAPESGTRLLRVPSSLSSKPGRVGQAVAVARIQGPARHGAERRGGLPPQRVQGAQELQGVQETQGVQGPQGVQGISASARRPSPPTLKAPPPVPTPRPRTSHQHRDGRCRELGGSKVSAPASPDPLLPGAGAIASLML